MRRMLESLVATLATAADVVLWSAARPGQRGTNHVNEREPSYWAQLWGEQGFRMLDVLRPGLQDSTIDIWYRQKRLAVRSTEAGSSNCLRLQRVLRRPVRLHSAPLGFVHPQVVAQWDSLPADQVASEMDAAASILLARLRQSRNIERVDTCYDDKLAMVAFRSPDSKGEPHLVMFSPYRTTLIIGLFFPAWCSSEADKNAYAERAVRAGLEWSSPNGRSLGGLMELSCSKLQAGLSVSLLTCSPTKGALEELGAEAEKLLRRFELGP